ncbi:uncharacterized protein LOC110809945 isoform X6 [Carica papaya]|uniref:uncharacterized protein LOC110809945 isoform X6 n=1 Tax=Carica papaya TaxID=3649 RepID=UPI000B8CA02D|nr:uncharacterized protein LOC110809945 isoform X6 [Carica papaya]
MAAVASYCKPSPFVTGQSHPRLGKSPLRLHVGISEKASRVTALFWGPKKSVEPQQLETSLGDFTLTGSGQEEVLGNQMMPKTISISVVSSISEVSSDEWDACTSDATGSEKFNPFLTHGFLSSLEESRSAVKARVSSLHITFPSETEWHKLKEKGFLQRTGMQYHWKNRNYKKNDCEILLFQSCCIKLMQEEARTTNG